MVTTQNYDLDIDTALGGSNASDYVIPSQKAIKTYVDNNSGGGGSVDTATLSYYGTCATGASTKAKVVVCEGFVLKTGASIRVKFTNAQSYNGQPTLNVNSTGAINVTSIGTTAAVRYNWLAGEIVSFTYDGTNWVMEDAGICTTTAYGYTKLTTSAVSTNSATALTPASLNSLVQNMIATYPVYSTSSTYAVGDRTRASYQVWECIVAIETPEAWTAAHWKALEPIQTQLDNKVNTADLATVATSGSYNDLTNKPTIPSEVTESTVSGWGFTKNVGTVTSVNNITPVNGNVTITIPDTSNLANKDLSNLSSTGNSKFQAPLVSGTNIKTINGNSLLGSGDITIQGGASYTASCPAITPVDGVATWSITHNLGSQAVVTALYSSNNKIEHNTLITSNNALTVTFKASSAVSAGSYKIVVLASGGSSGGGVDADLSNLSDTGKIAIAHNAMPSSTYIDLTLGANNTQYTMPSDGWLIFAKRSSGAGSYGEYGNLNNLTTGLFMEQTATYRTNVVSLLMPVKKGDVIAVGYNLNGATVSFRFYYTVGSESEAS